MEENLEKNIRKFLDTISAFVQVIMFKSPEQSGPKRKSLQKSQESQEEDSLEETM